MKILISGANGFVGSALVSHLIGKGNQVVALTRGEGGVHWNPAKGVLRKGDLEGFDVVIHLAGESIFERWSQEKKRKILSSRKAGTLLLATKLSELAHPPKVFISASAIGFYGDRGEELLTEESAHGNTFLAKVCIDWEKAARSCNGVRCVQARFGMVLGKGGALAQLVTLFKLGLGAVLGSGKQWVSWIALDDLVSAIDFIIHDPSIEGAVNVVSPHPVQQKEFVQEIGAVLKRPLFFRLPKWLLKVVFGQMAEEVLLSSARVVPKKLVRARFSFQFAHLREALLKALK